MVESGVVGEEHWEDGELLVCSVAQGAAELYGVVYALLDGVARELNDVVLEDVLELDVLNA